MKSRTEVGVGRDRCVVATADDLILSLAVPLGVVTIRETVAPKQHCTYVNLHLQTAELSPVPRAPLSLLTLAGRRSSSSNSGDEVKRDPVRHRDRSDPTQWVSPLSLAADAMGTASGGDHMRQWGQRLRGSDERARCSRTYFGALDSDRRHFSQ